MISRLVAFNTIVVKQLDFTVVFYGTSVDCAKLYGDLAEWIVKIKSPSLTSSLVVGTWEPRSVVEYGIYSVFFCFHHYSL